MTVAELKQLLEEYDDNVQVKVALDCDNDWGVILTAPTFRLQTPEIEDEETGDTVQQTDVLWISTYLAARCSSYDDEDDYEEV